MTKKKRKFNVKSSTESK